MIDGARFLVVMGVTGCGKSTVAAALAKRLEWPLLDADDLHDDASVAALRAGVPLVDEQRLPWLHRVSGWIAVQRDGGRSGVVACSALARRHRDVLRAPDVQFIYLAAARPLLIERLARRMGHFASPSLLASQLELLEPPAADERALMLDAASPVNELVSAATAATTVSGAPTVPAPNALRRHRDR